jgi:hypothetical protein
MKHACKSKLSLNRETIRSLAGNQLSHVAGGAIPKSDVCTAPGTGGTDTNTQYCPSWGTCLATGCSG